MGAEGFHGRVRNGVGWVTLAMVTKPSDQGDRMAWLSWISGHPIVDDRAASVLGNLGHPIVLARGLLDRGTAVLWLGLILARLVCLVERAWCWLVLGGGRVLSSD